MDLLSKILECKTDEEANIIVKEELEKMQNNILPVEQLGFLTDEESVSCYKGFIPFKTRIKYCNRSVETYGMESTDFFYEFVHFIRKYNINNKFGLIHKMEYFINQYFGYPGESKRETIFNSNAYISATTDEEYWALLENNKLGDLKGKGAAECTERGALAQQLLSLFGTEVYYCMGCVDLGNRQEGHCFNVVKRKYNYALLDYSIPVSVYNEDGSFKAHYPFVGILSKEEFIDFVNNGSLKNFKDYQYIGEEIQSLSSSRNYIVGSYSIEKEKTR